MSAAHPVFPSTSPRIVSSLQAVLAVAAAAVLALRTVRTALGQGVASTSDAALAVGAGLAGATGALAVAAAVLVVAGHRRAAALALGATLMLEIVVLDRVAAPPRLLTALPLGLALALFLADRPMPGRRAATPPLRTAAAVVGVLLMLPVGVQYLVSGLVVPEPDLYGMYLLYGAFLVGAVLLARRRTWWVLAVAPAAVATWFVLITLGGQFWGWQA